MLKLISNNSNADQTNSDDTLDKYRRKERENINHSHQHSIYILTIIMTRIYYQFRRKLKAFVEFYEYFRHSESKGGNDNNVTQS